jgi:hypothetical protein
MNPFLRTTVVTATLLLAATLAHSQTRYTYSTTGDEVTDTKTGLTWRRCSEGQAWSGTTCTGTAATYTQEQALAHAKSQASVAGWRLPNVKELSSITDKTRSNPAIDTTAFPATPSSWYWSSTPEVGASNSAWYVLFNYGYVVTTLRFWDFHVRLVR